MGFHRHLSEKSQLMPTRSLLPPRQVPIFLFRQKFVPLPTLKSVCLSTGHPSRWGSSSLNTFFSMAKSKSGGSRSYLRGRLGADVYSIGKDGKGKKQQVVRSLAEQVSNPQTSAQMFGRMVMATVMQAVSGLAFIVDHSFDAVANGQPSISEFIRRNYQLVRADADTNPAAGNKFQLNEYQEKGIKAGEYVLSDGSAIAPANVAKGEAVGSLVITVNGVAEANGMTGKAVADALGISEGDYVTLVVQTAQGSVAAVRLHYPASAQLDTAVTADNWRVVFDAEVVGTAPTLTVAAGSITVAYGVGSLAYAVIASRKSDSGYSHSPAQFALYADNTTGAADSVFPTYPIGQERFLNGGDL